MGKPTDLIPSQEAMKLLGVSTKTMAKLLADKTLRHYTKPLDRRVKWVSRADVEKLRDSYEVAA
jgi:DNA-binding transcriptional regulator YiaG